MQAIMTIGVSASGKSSYAHMMELEGYEVIERDRVRFTEVVRSSTGWRGKNPYKFTRENEAEVTKSVFAKISQHASEGANIILSDTWVDKKNRRQMYKLLQQNGYHDIKVVTIHVPLLVAIERDSYRGNFSVGEDIIRKQWDKFQASKAQIVDEKREFGLEVIDFDNFGDYKGKELL